ncbi:MAG: damage-control phosphatase ARMT1 family protein [Planctomycetota bacterium]
MHTALTCLTCHVRMAVEVAERVFADDAQAQQGLIRDALRIAADADFDRPPPVIAAAIQRRLRQLCGGDPYAAIKVATTAAALELLPTAAAEVASHPDPLAAALRIAAAGNIIDAGLRPDVDAAAIVAALRAAANAPFAQGALVRLKQRLATADRILYIADNAGELVFDRLVLDRLPAGRVTLVVRGGPILNDATVDDLAPSGIDPAIPIIASGDDAPGTVLDDCSGELREAFAAADVVISKGQGNYETLEGCGREVFFALTVKCPAVAALSGQAVGSLLLRFGGLRGSAMERRA